MKVDRIIAASLEAEPMFLAGRICRENAWGQVRDAMPTRDRAAFDAGWLDASVEIAERSARAQP